MLLCIPIALLLLLSACAVPNEHKQLMLVSAAFAAYTGLAGNKDPICA